MFMLIDCDNFFVSCERVFRPELKRRPVVVLSNNDGCVISRSNEAKALGIPMGCPYFKVKAAFTARGGIALSGRRGLYSDMSRRIMGLLKTFYDHTEVYSIDEAFVRLPEGALPEKEAPFIRELLGTQTGLPVSVGAAPTKTLCKAAAEMAKKKEGNNFEILSDEARIDAALAAQNAADLWGIGRRTALRLNFLGVITALDLKKAPHSLIRKNLGINTDRIVTELNGIPCREHIEEGQQSFVCSRTFEREISGFDRLKSVTAEFTEAVCRRLRRHESAAALTVFIENSRFDTHRPYCRNVHTETLSEMTDNTARFMTALDAGLEKVWRPGFRCKRAGVMLSDVENVGRLQGNLFIPPDESLKSRKLMQAFDALNEKMGDGTLFFGMRTPGPRKETEHTAFSGLPEVR